MDPNEALSWPKQSLDLLMATSQLGLGTHEKLLTLKSKC